MPGESPAFFLFLFIEKRACGLQFAESSILYPLFALILLWATPALSYVNESRSAFQISVGTHPRCVWEILMVTAVHRRPCVIILNIVSTCTPDVRF